MYLTSIPSTLSLLLATLLIAGGVFECTSALRLNLTAACADTAVYFCTVSNISATFNDPLVVVNSSQPQLSELVLRNSLIPRIPREVFVQAPELRVFFMHNCGLNRLTDSDLVKANLLRKLVLQRNRIFDLPEKAFSVATTLQELHLGANTIRMVHHSSLSGLVELKYLDLQQNGIHTLPKGVFVDLTALEHIDLSENELEQIDTGTFATNSRLKTVLLSNNKFSVFESNALEHLPHLRLLDVSNCQLDELSVQSVDTLMAQNSALKRCAISGSVIKLHAGNNELSDITIGDKLTLREADLHGNLFESLDDFIGMLNLQRLDMSKNRLHSLRTSHSPLYLPLPSLTNLNLASNQLQNLSADNFLLLQKLTHLDLAYNHLVRLDQRIFEPLLNLEKLYLEGNRLHTFDYETFLQTHKFIREMGLSSNDWEYRYKRTMANYLRNQNIHLSVRYTPSTAPQQGGYESGTIATDLSYEPTKAHAPHETAVSLHDDHDGEAFAEKIGSVGGIHPYWTRRDILAMLVLVGVAVVILLQFYTILREEGCLPPPCCCGNDNVLVPERQGRPHRLDEEDSEV